MSDAIFRGSPYEMGDLERDLAFFDPFIGTAKQTTRRKAYCKIIVAGVDVTSRVEPHLVSVRILDGAAPYQCEIELDDRDGRLPIPPMGSNVTAIIGWQNEETKFEFGGVIIDVEHGFGRKQGGRRMWVRASGTNWLSNIKTPLTMHDGEGAPPGAEMGEMVEFGKFAGKVAAAGGATIKMHPKLQSILNDYWSVNGESSMNFLQRKAQELGGLMIIRNGNQIEMTLPGEGTDGARSGEVLCKWGDNLIGWRVRPIVARSSWQKTNQSYYNVMQGIWNKVNKSLNLPMPWGKSQATYALPAPAPNSTMADNQNEGVSSEGQYPGEGRIVINGEPTARFNMYAVIQGARPGVDGAYLIKMAEHMYSRQGYITWLDVYAQASSSSSGIGRKGYEETTT